jgi:hypothetical protein
MKDAKGHGSDARGDAAHQGGVNQVGRVPMTMYHGSAKDFDTFELGHGAGASRNGVWLADDPHTAVEYAQIGARYGGTPMMYETAVHGNFATQQHWDDAERKSTTTGPFHERDAQTIGRLKDAGFDGVRFGNTLYVFDPSKITITGKRKL